MQINKNVPAQQFKDSLFKEQNVLCLTFDPESLSLH